MALKHLPGTARDLMLDGVRTVVAPLLSALILASCAEAPPMFGGGALGSHGTREHGGRAPSEQASALAMVLKRAAAASSGAREADHRYELARNLVEAERLSEALAAYDELLTSNPRNIRAHDGRGVVFDLMGRHAEAQEAYRASLSVHPDALATRNNLGLSLALSGDVSAAILLLRAVASHPNATARHRQNLALAYGLAGHEEAAAAVAAVDLDEHTVARNLEYYRTARRIRADVPSPAAKGSPELP